ncbi:MAG: histidine kinase [Lachnospiraceae bacterium]|nr:histidine kinase [Lachnospiraceae bacterium]
MSKRLKQAILILVAVPAFMILTVFVMGRIFAIKNVSLVNSVNDRTTDYINEGVLYALSGEMVIVPGEHVDPSPRWSSRTTVFPTDTANRMRTAYKSFTAESISDVYTDKCVSGKDYKASLCMQFKLPSGTDYAMIFPAAFCEHEIYVNGLSVSTEKRSETFGFLLPTPKKIYLPYNPAGGYEVLINIVSSKGFTGGSFDSVLVGASDVIDTAYDFYTIFNIVVLCFIITSMVFLCLQLLAFKKSRILISFILYFAASLLYVFTRDDFSLVNLGISFPLNIMLLLKSVATPLYTASILLICYRLFPYYFPSKAVMIIEFLQIFPIISDLSFKTFPLLTYISDFVLVLPLVPCLYVFALSFEGSEKYSLRFGICLFLAETDVLLRHATGGLSMPAMYVYFPTIGGFMILNVLMMADKYKHQNSTEIFYEVELSKYLNALQASENAFLNAQIKPHFLYNTLNTIADLCVTDPEKAKGLIDSLTEYLKLILDLDNMEEQVSLERELELARAYTAIEKERFPSIRFYTDYPLKMPKISLPALTIQPLIENAIKHGVRKSNRPGAVTLRIMDNPDGVYFYVSDNGVGMNEETIKGLFKEPKENKSIGIYNIDKRLRNQYGNGLSIDSTVDLGTCVTFKVPK